MEEQTGAEASASTSDAGAPDTFYRDFEARFRGDQALIIDRLRVYEPFIRPLVAQGDARALDLGCGRGEWLKLLGEWGVVARGVDLDAGMLTEARANGLTVVQQDALEALRAVPDGDLLIVSGFHIAEHLPFDVLRALVNEARRVLRPGGVLILETPNPENPVVGLVNFHLDASHVRPLPPMLMGFIAEYSGFARHAILRLQGADPRPETAGDLASLLSDVSFDHAIVAQVEGPNMNELDPAFAHELGMSLDAGVARFDSARAERRAAVEAKLGSEFAALRAKVGARAADTADLHREAADLRAEVGTYAADTADLHREAADLRAEVGTYAADTADLHREAADLRAEVGARAAETVDLRAEVEAMRYRLDRSWIERLLFRSSGRPVRAFRRMMFHSSGKPRGVVRKWVWDAHRNPRPAFARWMNSPEYLALRWPALRRAPAAPRKDVPLLAESWSPQSVVGHPLRADLVARLESLAARARVDAETSSRETA